jgi:hypothetical protein
LIVHSQVSSPNFSNGTPGGNDICKRSNDTNRLFEEEGKKGGEERENENGNKMEKKKRRKRETFTDVNTLIIDMHSLDIPELNLTHTSKTTH